MGVGRGENAYYERLKTEHPYTEHENVPYLDGFRYSVFGFRAPTVVLNHQTFKRFNSCYKLTRHQCVCGKEGPEAGGEKPFYVRRSLLPTYVKMWIIIAGFFHWRNGGEKHINEPASIAALQEATKYGQADAYSKYVQASMAAIRDCTLRGRLYIKNSDNPIDISEVRQQSTSVGA